MNEHIGKTLIVIGVLFIIVGILFTITSKFTSLPKLPGDIYIKKDHVTFYFPWVTSLVISILLSAVAYFLIRK